VARVVALVPDLMFGSRVLALLREAGHEVSLVGDETIARAQAPDCDVLVVDLTSDVVDGSALVDSMRAGAELGQTRTLGCYSHVDAEMRDRALRAGFDEVVPRSRMVREGGALVSALAASAG